ncbi:MAG: hypothetical protein RLZZ127_1301 [Planctomycetota bacterium]|jgi:hypothetical protein
MDCLVLRADPAQLIAALTAPETLERYQERLQSESASLADKGMIAHVRTMARLAAAAQVGGIDALAASDRQAADGLLTDLLAVSLWHGDPLPVERLGESPFDPAGRPRGLLGADRNADGAGLWRADDGTLRFARIRETGDYEDVCRDHR